MFSIIISSIVAKWLNAIPQLLRFNKQNQFKAVLSLNLFVFTLYLIYSSPSTVCRTYEQAHVDTDCDVNTLTASPRKVAVYSSTYDQPCFVIRTCSNYPVRWMWMIVYRPILRYSPRGSLSHSIQMRRCMNGSASFTMTWYRS